MTFVVAEYPSSHFKQPATDTTCTECQGQFACAMAVVDSGGVTIITHSVECGCCWCRYRYYLHTAVAAHRGHEHVRDFHYAVGD
eukprot:scaffold174357_cov28-Tisochrysis_lutea.AAC.1